MAESLRAEARRRGVTVYQVRVERGAGKGLTPSVAVGKPRRGERTIRETAKGIDLARRSQPSKYRLWFSDGTEIKASIDTDYLPDLEVGDEAFQSEGHYASDHLTLVGITVQR